jgi:DNA recombination protein RmuC
MIMEITLLVITVLLLLFIVFQSIINKRKDPDGLPDLENALALLQKSLTTLESNFKEDFRLNRKEITDIARDNRDELNKTLKDLTDNTSSQLEKITGKVEMKLKELNDQSKTDNYATRDTLTKAFGAFEQSFERNVKSFNDLQREKFNELGKKQDDLVLNTEKKLEGIRITVEEKLEKTLSARVSESFESVGKQLNEVQKGLGEMQTLAQDVGGLKKVLSNVKMRGAIGEFQLANLLEQILAPDQYEKNVKTKHGSNDIVEFAIKLPGKDEDNSQVWLPVDAKFPKDVYEKLQTAYDHGDLAEIETAQKNLDNTIRKMAKDISDKYVDPPHTTDFAIMFLPFEGIYAEVVRKAALLQELQQTYKVVVTGPTTFAAILNSLHIGFRTLAIQQRSSEVWRVLVKVKAEFEKFGGVIQKAQKNIQSGLTQLDDVVGVRTRAIRKELRNVESMNADQVKLFLPEAAETDTTDEEIEE